MSLRKELLCVAHTQFSDKGASLIQRTRGYIVMPSKQGYSIPTGAGQNYMPRSFLFLARVKVKSCSCSQGNRLPGVIPNTALVIMSKQSVNPDWAHTHTPSRNRVLAAFTTPATRALVTATKNSWHARCRPRIYPVCSRFGGDRIRISRSSCVPLWS